jgi:hypothetical protein
VRRETRTLEGRSSCVCLAEAARTLTTFLPRLVLIEFNPTIPNEILFVPDPGRDQGCSLCALVDLGQRKGYELAATTDGNAFFVRTDLFPALGIADNSIDAVHGTHPHQTRIFQLYDGSVMLTGNQRLRWQPGRISATGEIPMRSRIWAALRKAKHELRWRLRRLGLRQWPPLSGSRRLGVDLAVPRRGPVGSGMPCVQARLALEFNCGKAGVRSWHI